MITPEHGDDPAVRSIVELKRQLTELKLEALLRSGGTVPTTSVHDIDAIVDETVAGLTERRRARPPVSEDHSPRCHATNPNEVRTPSNRWAGEGVLSPAPARGTPVE